MKERLFDAIEKNNLSEFIYDTLNEKPYSEVKEFGTRDNVVYFDAVNLVVYDYSGDELLHFDEFTVNDLSSEYYLTDNINLISALQIIEDAEEVLIIEE